MEEFLEKLKEVQKIFPGCAIRYDIGENTLTFSHSDVEVVEMVVRADDSDDSDSEGGKIVFKLGGARRYYCDDADEAVEYVIGVLQKDKFFVIFTMIQQLREEVAALRK
ncbi:hypothetical protein BNJ_00208 [Kaumoebavirus]|uniref:hypothetical protein n=1 Tax=Kaumoebavirus TaxID=1859492 RepID=UPI0009C32CC1|nr:hypothetical protein BNJ_00208 [Kaumoebavirus]ARA72038.1 hypothetical protein BNJ_00208 [Kaumoebavirus]